MPLSKQEEDANNPDQYQVDSYHVNVAAKSKFKAAGLSIDATIQRQHKNELAEAEKAAKEEQAAEIAAAAVSPKQKFRVAAIAAKNNRQQEEKKDDANNITNGKGKTTAEDNWTRVGYGAKMAALRAKNYRASSNEKLFSRAVVSANTWDIWSPPPGNTLSGKVVPRLINKHKHRRKCSLEIHRVTPMVVEAADETDAENKEKSQSQTQTRVNQSYHECVVRMMVPANRDLSRKVKLDALKGLASHDTPSSSDMFTSVRQIRFDETDFEHDEDDNTVDSTSSSSTSASAVSAKYRHIKDNGGREYEGWAPRYCLPIHGIYVRGHHKKTVTIFISFNDFKQERDLIFDTNDDARSFVKHIEKQKRLETVRQDDRLAYALGGEIVLPKFENITLLFEIVSAYDLPVGDYISSDPYVSAFLGHQKIHQTDYRSKTLNPVWTLKTGSLFILNVESRRFFIEEGVKFVVKDFDKIGSDEVLGICKVDPKVFYKANGERMEFKLIPPRKPNAGSRDGGESSTGGTLAIRCRRATQYDQKFMADFSKQQKKNAKGVASYNAPEADTSVFKTLTTKVKKRDSSGDILYKTRPFPDPKLPPGHTEWMTKEDLQEAVLKPSHQWVDIGEGSLGKVYLEILGCDGLPNMDIGAFYGNKTDTFVACVYEDVYGRTDVIDDCLSPRWLPWSHRAFTFHIAHPSSFLNLGIFDFDSGGDRLADHDLIGRVSVDLTNFRSATEYVLSYNICPSARLSPRKSLGKIMIRLRMEVPDERKLAMAALYPPPPIYVNTKSRKDFDVIRKTCFGSVDEDRYSVSTLKSYIDEIYELQYTLFYIEDGLMALLLWRGHCEWTVPLVEIEVNIPLHSIIAFVMTTFLVEYPTLIPCFCFGSLAWLLLAIGVWRRGAENVWWRCHSYEQIFKMLTLGDDYAEPHNIQPFENFENAKREAEDLVKRIEESEKLAARTAKEANIAELKLQKELAELGATDTNLATNTNSAGATANPVKAALYPIQILLGILVRVIRIIKNILSWQEAYLSFWITTGSLVLAILSLFVPWMWCIKWGSRILAWTIFGPWMKFLDIYYFQLIKLETKEQCQLREKAEKLAQKLVHNESIVKARIDRENNAKLKSMKQYMFGKFALRIPILKQDRFADIPLAESFATPYQEKDFSLAELAMQEAGYNSKRIPGQTLIGDMIPFAKEENFTLAPTGKAALHTEKLSRYAPGSNGGLVTKPRQILTMISLAIGITYFGTSLVAKLLVQTDEWISVPSDEEL
jgi:hypothetical protein